LIGVSKSSPEVIMSNAKHNALLTVAVCLLALAAVLGITATPAHASTTTCAGISNVTNNAWWRSGGKLHVAHYSDMGGPRLVFDRPVPRAVRLAEAKLIEFDSEGNPITGPKVRHACA
jgi:hypothetical protein